MTANQIIVLVWLAGAIGLGLAYLYTEGFRVRGWDESETDN